MGTKYLCSSLAQNLEKQQQQRRLWNLMCPCSQQELKMSTILVSILLALLEGENHNKRLYCFHQFKGRAELLNTHTQSVFCILYWQWEWHRKENQKRIKDTMCMKTMIRQYSRWHFIVMGHCECTCCQLFRSNQIISNFVIVIARVLYHEFSPHWGLISLFRNCEHTNPKV